MWWSDRAPRRARLAAVLLAAALLAGCAFSPVYAPGGAGAALNGAVTVIPPEGSAAFVLARRLEERLGPPADPTFDLAFGLATDTDRIAITAAQETNRFNLIGRADWQLTRDGAVVAEGRAESFTSYSAAGTPVANRAAERDAEERLMRILSDRIMADLVTGAGALP